MTHAEEVVEKIEVAGGQLALNGHRISFRLPENAAALLDDLRANKDDVILLLQKRETIPAMPPGVKLLKWARKPTPVLLTRFSVVTDVSKFISTTLKQLEAALDGHPWQAGHWSVDELIERLEQCGAFVKVIEVDHA